MEPPNTTDNPQISETTTQDDVESDVTAPTQKPEIQNHTEACETNDEQHEPGSKEPVAEKEENSSNAAEPDKNEETATETELEEQPEKQDPELNEEQPNEKPLNSELNPEIVITEPDNDGAPESDNEEPPSYNTTHSDSSKANEPEPAESEVPSGEPAKPIESEDQEQTKTTDPVKPEDPPQEQSNMTKDEEPNEVVSDSTADPGKPDAEEKTEQAVEATADNLEGVAGAAQSSPGDHPDFSGKYRQISAENTEAFFKAVGLNWFLRKLVTKFSPSTEIVQDGSNFHIKLVTGIMTKEWKFTVGEEFREKPGGWSDDYSKVNTWWEDGQLVMHAVPETEKNKDKAMKQSRFMEGDQMTVKFEIGDVVCTRVFQRKN